MQNHSDNKLLRKVMAMGLNCVLNDIGILCIFFGSFRVQCIYFERILGSNHSLEVVSGHIL